MRVRIIVAVLVAVLVFYFVLLADRAFTLIGSGSVAGIALGVGVLLLPLIGVVLVVWELRFGWRTQQLGRRLTEGEGADAVAAQDWPAAPDLPRRPSGRVERDAADAWFETVKDKVEAAPDDWRGWYRLAQAYDLSGDRKRARSAMRKAIDLSA